MSMQEDRLRELRAQWEERGARLRAIQEETLREQAVSETNAERITALEAERAALSARVQELEGSS